MNYIYSLLLIWSIFGLFLTGNILIQLVSIIYVVFYFNYKVIVFQSIKKYVIDLISGFFENELVKMVLFSMSIGFSLLFLAGYDPYKGEFFWGDNYLQRTEFFIVSLVLGIVFIQIGNKKQIIKNKSSAILFSSLIFFSSILFSGVYFLFEKLYLSYSKFIEESEGRLIFFDFFGAGSQLDAGQLGDFFGGILNPIVGFSSLIVLTITLIVMYRNMIHSKESADIFKEQLLIQRFEDNFFKLVDLHNSIVEKLSFSPSVVNSNKVLVFQYKNNSNEMFYGSDVFVKVVELLSKKQLGNLNTSKAVIRLYSEIQSNNNNILSHYFRNLYQVIKYIKNNNNLLGNHANEYSAILRAQLSTPELVLLFLNCLDEIHVDTGEFKLLLIEYKLLEHLPIVNSSNGGFLLAGVTEVRLNHIKQYYYYDDKGKLHNGFGTNPIVKELEKRITNP